MSTKDTLTHLWGHSLIPDTTISSQQLIGVDHRRFISTLLPDWPPLESKASTSSDPTEEWLDWIGRWKTLIENSARSSNLLKPNR